VGNLFYQYAANGKRHKIKTGYCETLTGSLIKRYRCRWP